MIGKLNKILIGTSAVSTAAIVALTDLSGSGAKLLWAVPALLAGNFLADSVLYAGFAYIGSELTIDLNKQNDEPSKFWSRQLELISEWLCCWGRIKVEVTGLEKLPQERFLMVCNHRSYFDPIVKIPVFKNIGMTYISKPGNFKIPIGGKLMHAYGCLPLNRDNNREALVTIKRAAEIIRSDRASVCIYPEGTRSRNDELLPFHAGSFKSAQKLGCPVVVTTLYGTDTVAKNFPFGKTVVKIDITEVLDKDYVKSHKTKEIAALAQDIIQNKYNEFLKET